MCKIVPITKDYITPINHLYQKYISFLEDDYNEDTLADLIKRTYPFFCVILSDTSSFVGFLYLDNIIGNSRSLHSAEINVCIHPKFWGDFTKNNAATILDYCFKQFNLIKIKACIYPENGRVKKLLDLAGFQKEATLHNETVRKGKLQDIEIYSIYRKGI